MDESFNQDVKSYGTFLHKLSNDRGSEDHRLQADTVGIQKEKRVISSIGFSQKTCTDCLIEAPPVNSTIEYFKLGFCTRK